MIEMDACSLRIIDCPIFQRLRTIRQLGLSFFTYPTAQHSRFEHSLGVYHVISRLLAEFQITVQNEDTFGNGIKAVAVETSEETLVKHAALLHDIGHVVFFSYYREIIQ